MIGVGLFVHVGRGVSLDAVVEVSVKVLVNTLATWFGVSLTACGGMAVENVNVPPRTAKITINTAISITNVSTLNLLHVAKLC